MPRRVFWFSKLPVSAKKTWVTPRSWSIPRCTLIKMRMIMSSLRGELSLMPWLRMILVSSKPKLIRRKHLPRKIRRQAKQFRSQRVRSKKNRRTRNLQVILARKNLFCPLVLLSQRFSALRKAPNLVSKPLAPCHNPWPTTVALLPWHLLLQLCKSRISKTLWIPSCKIHSRKMEAWLTDFRARRSESLTLTSSK